MDSITSTITDKVVLFVGSNPSNASTCDQAFHDTTKSSKILTAWCKDLDAVKIYINVLNQKTPNNRPLKKSEIVLNLDRLKSDIDLIKPDRIVALGRTAEAALKALGLNFLAMPHPSGLNRLLNDKAFVDRKVAELKAYVNL